MGDHSLLFFALYTGIFCMIFWILTLLGSYFYSKKLSFSKFQFYECGFRVTNDISTTITFPFTLFAAFLVLYDIEFTFIIPLLFNLTYIYALIYASVAMFCFLFFCSFFYDWQAKILTWQM